METRQLLFFLLYQLINKFCLTSIKYHYRIFFTLTAIVIITLLNYLHTVRFNLNLMCGLIAQRRVIILNNYNSLLWFNFTVWFHFIVKFILTTQDSYIINMNPWKKIISVHKQKYVLKLINTNIQIKCRFKFKLYW